MMNIPKKEAISGKLEVHKCQAREESTGSLRTTEDLWLDVGEGGSSRPGVAWFGNFSRRPKMG
jgi:hypothetical protein